jgi:hypothetical protein
MPIKNRYDFTDYALGSKIPGDSFLSSVKTNMGNRSM